MDIILFDLNKMETETERQRERESEGVSKKRWRDKILGDRSETRDLF